MPFQRLYSVQEVTQETEESALQGFCVPICVAWQVDDTETRIGCIDFSRESGMFPFLNFNECWRPFFSADLTSRTNVTILVYVVVAKSGRFTR